MASGSVVKRTGDRSGYQARWREYPGGPWAGSKSFARKVDAQQYLTKVLRELETGEHIDQDKARVTVEEFYEKWSARKPWRDKTRSTYRTSFTVHILPTFGHRPLGTVQSTGEVEDWITGLDLKPSSKRLVLSHFSAMFEGAIRDNHTKVNPVRGAARPKDVDEHQGGVTPFSLEELRRLEEAAAPWFAVVVPLGAWVGLRQSEVRGLTFDRVDFLRRVLKVDRQRVGADGFGPLKTKRSYRTVPLLDETLDRLAAHLQQFGAGPDGLILHEKGRSVTAERFVDVWDQTRKRAGLPGVRFHNTRHTYASALLSGGVNPAAAAEYLGDTVTTMLQTYAHLMPRDEEVARAALRAALPRAIGDPLVTGEGGGGQV
jgi:integrase